MTFKVKFVVYGCCLHVKQTGFVTFRSLQNEDCGLQSGCKMQTVDKMQTAEQGSNVDGSLQLFLSTVY